MFTPLFTFMPRGMGFIYLQGDVFIRVLLPSVHPGVGRTRIIPPNSDPISISPNLFWDPG